MVRLEVHVPVPVGTLAMMFQFLNGAIGRKSCLGISLFILCFNSLMVRLEDTPGNCSFTEATCVSIP